MIEQKIVYFLMLFLGLKNKLLSNIKKNILDKKSINLN